jgi:hypothetical protein
LSNWHAPAATRLDGAVADLNFSAMARC